MRDDMVLILACSLLTACEGDTFECGGKALVSIPADLVCDGVPHCWHGQDEKVDGCLTELAYCEGPPESQAILLEQVCDGVDDCPGGFDEQDCESG